MSPEELQMWGPRKLEVYELSPVVTPPSSPGVTPPSSPDSPRRSARGIVPSRRFFDFGMSLHLNLFYTEYTFLIPFQLLLIIENQ